MIRSTILTVFLFLLVLSVKASPLPEPLPEAIPQEDDAQVACPPAPAGCQPQSDGNERPEEVARQKQEQQEAVRQKKEEERMAREHAREQHDAERAKADEERARYESSHASPAELERQKKEEERMAREHAREQHDSERAKADEERARYESSHPHNSNGEGGQGVVPENTGQQPSSPPPVQLAQVDNNNNHGTQNNQGTDSNTGQGGVNGNTNPPSNDQPSGQPPGTSTTPNTTPLDGKAHQGPATFYGGNLDGGNCMFRGYKLPGTLKGAALGASNWDNSANCGACAEVRGNGKKVVVMYVDQCSDCGDGLDFFPDGFSALNKPSVGRFPVEWNFVKCPVEGPIFIKNRDGTNKDYVSMQVQNGKEPTAKIEISTDGGNTFTPGRRDNTNFFVFGVKNVLDKVVVRATSKSGKVVVVPGFDIAGAAKAGPSNY